MALEKLTQDVANISKLDNYPPDDPGMTPDKLKQLFDKGSVTIKDYINNVLIPQLEAGFIDSIARTSGDGSPGTTDTYTITFHDGSTKTFQIYNGRDGIDGEKGDKGDTGNGIASAVLNEDYTLTLTFTDGTSYTTPSIRGAKGDKGDKGDKGEKGDKGDTGAGLEFDWNGTQLGVRVEGDGAYQYVDLKGETGPAGRGIASVTKKSGTGAPGTYDTYTITFTDGTTFDFQVYNGADGEGAGDMLKAVYDTDNDGKVDAAEVADYADEAGHAETADSATSAGYATTAGSANSVSWSNVQNPPSTYAPSAHANSHKTGGSDALSAADIGAVPTLRKINNKELTSDITLDKSDIGLGNVDNVKQMPIAGGTFTGKAYAQSNTDYTTAQIRNIVLSDSDPSGGNDGDIWIKYS